jgi:integrase/recombinase XerD
MKNEELAIPNLLRCTRHHFATVALSLGIDIMVNNMILEHKEPGATPVYSKLQDKRKIEEVNKLFSKTYDHYIILSISASDQ